MKKAVGALVLLIVFAWTGAALADEPSGTLVVRNQTDATIALTRSSYLGSETVIPPNSVVVLEDWLKVGNTSVQVNALCVEGVSGYGEEYWVSGQGAKTHVLVINPDNFGKSIMFDKRGCGVSQGDAADQARCLTYAQKAMAQLGQSLDLKCKFKKGGKWARKRQEHLDWCLSVGPEQAAALERERAEDLAECVARKEKAPWCEEYAMESMLQYERAVTNNCRVKGPFWTRDYGTHYEFCMDFSQNRTQKELDAREARLAECAEQKERDGFCRDYAAQVLEMRQAGVDMECDLTGADWSEDFNEHREYCLQASDEYAEQDLAAHRAELDQCRKQKEREKAEEEADQGEADAEKAERCQGYATSAVEQFKVVDSMECGYWGELWHGNREAHIEWCMEATDQELINAAQTRQANIYQCAERKNREN